MWGDNAISETWLDETLWCGTMSKGLREEGRRPQKPEGVSESGQLREKSDLGPVPTDGGLVETCWLFSKWR